MALLFLSIDADELNYKKHGADWTDLCSTGHTQSPIDIPEAVYEGIHTYTQRSYFYSDNIEMHLESSLALDFYTDYQDFTNKTIYLNNTHTFYVPFTDGLLGLVDPFGNQKVF